MIRNLSKSETYESFVSSYESCIDRVEQKEIKRKEDSAATANLLRFKKIERAIAAVHQIMMQISEMNIREWVHMESSSIQRPDSYYQTQRFIMHRLLLLYHEIPYLKGKWYLTYDTGYPPLDKQIHSILGGLLKKPQTLTHENAEKYAKSIYLACHDLACQNQVPGLWAEDNEKQLREDFGTRYRREYTPSRSIFPPWTDTSDNRNP